MINGYDVASYQAEHFPVEGIDFAIIKVTEGTGYVNPKWRAQREWAKSHGLSIGFYHFARPGVMLAQVEHFLAQIALESGDHLWFDWEDAGVSSEDKDTWIKFVQTRTHHRVGLYCNRNFLDNRDRSKFHGDGLWIATGNIPMGQPGIVSPWLIHQYSTAGGIDHDVARFNTRADMVTWAKQEVAPMTYTPPPFPTGLHPGGKTPSARPLQKALKTAGYMSKLVLYTDTYGGYTTSAVMKFHRKNPAYGGYNDGAIGPKGWAELHREAYAPKPVTEPAHDYHRVTYGSKTVNVRTRTMLQRAEALLGRKFLLLQGSYSKGVSASAGTHDGGGVVDVSVAGMTDLQRKAAVQALRKVGFAAWHRVPPTFSHHIHACAINDHEMAPLAKKQVQAYFNGRDGLAANGPDPNPPRPWPSWAAKYNL